MISRTPRATFSADARIVSEWKERLVANEANEQSRSRACLLVGVVLLALAAGFGVAGLLLLDELRPESARASGVSVWTISAWAGSIMTVVMLVLAWFTKPESRADVADQMVDANYRESMRQDHPLIGVGLTMFMIILLYGAYAIVESIKRSRVRHKLRSVDRVEAARVMALTSASPVGVPLAELAKPGSANQSLALNRTLALLMLDGWIDLVDRGTVVTQTAPTMRSLRRPHPLIELFGYSSPPASP